MPTRKPKWRYLGDYEVPCSELPKNTKSWFARTQGQVGWFKGIAKNLGPEGWSNWSYDRETEPVLDGLAELGYDRKELGWMEELYIQYLKPFGPPESTMFTKRRVGSMEFEKCYKLTYKPIKKKGK